MENWLSYLKFNPLNKLLSSGDEILTFFIKRDLLNENNIKSLENKEIELIINKQQSNGSWIFKSNSINKYPSINHDLVETFKSLRILVGKYEMDKSHQAISKAAEYVFSCQTDEGDFRGILGNQYMPYYCGLLLEYLIIAGYENDVRIKNAFKWLNNIRQNDGSWVIPLQTIKINKFNDSIYASEPIVADKNLPSSHLATGMVLRAYAAHKNHRNSEIAHKAGELLKSRFFKADKYNDRKSPEYWLKFQYPFWWTTILSALDSLYYLGFRIDDDDIGRVIEWFFQNQNDDGLWNTNYNKGIKENFELRNLWVAYSICKVLKLYLN